MDRLEFSKPRFKLNPSNATDWNQYLTKLWKDNGHEPDVSEIDNVWNVEDDNKL